jgi:arabinogalactan oligomer/maltooligosaccharide transport system permease protein
MLQLQLAALRTWKGGLRKVISLTPEIMIQSFITVFRFLLLILAALAVMESVLYTLSHRRPKTPLFGLAILALTVALAFAFWRFVRPAEGLETAVKAGIGVALLLADMGLYWLVSSPHSTRLGLAYLLLAPALVGISALMLYPFAYNVYLAFSNMGMMTIRTFTVSLANGIENFRSVFTGVVAHDATFWEVLGRTILWTAINVFFHVTGGMALALLLNRPLRFKGLYRTLLVFPWAIPQTIACMALRNEFNFQFGFFNVMLRNLGLTPINWLTDPTWAFIALCISNIWLGIPFMMVVILGGLQSISREYYEAAEMDGASGVQQFRNITLPLLQPVLTPAVILGTAWTFNALNVIYLITRGNPQEKTDILVSSLYKAAFDFYRYGFAAAFALVIFGFLLLFAVLYIRATGGLKAAWE